MATVASGELGTDSHISGYLCFSVYGEAINPANLAARNPVGYTPRYDGGVKYILFKIVKTGAAFTPGAFKGMTLTTTKKFSGAMNSDFVVYDNGADWILCKIPLVTPTIINAYFPLKYEKFTNALQGAASDDGEYVITGADLANPWYSHPLAVGTTHKAAFLNPWSVSDVAPAAVPELDPDGPDAPAAETVDGKKAFLFAHNIGKSDGVSPDLGARSGKVTARVPSDGSDVLGEFNDRDAYDAAATYFNNDSVTYLDKRWISLTGPTSGVAPGSDPTKWLQCSARVDVADDWDSNALVGLPVTLIRAADFSTETALITINTADTITADWLGAYPVVDDILIIGAIDMKVWTGRIDCGLPFIKKEFSELWVKVRKKTVQNEDSDQLLFVLAYVDGKAARNIPLNDTQSSSEDGVTHINGVAAMKLQAQVSGEFIRYPISLSNVIGVDIQLCLYAFDADTPIEIQGPLELKYRVPEGENPR